MTVTGTAITGNGTGFASVLASWLSEGAPLHPTRVPDSAGRPVAFAALRDEYAALQRAWTAAQGWLGSPSDDPVVEMLRDELETWAWITIQGCLERASDAYLRSMEGVR